MKLTTLLMLSLLLLGPLGLGAADNPARHVEIRVKGMVCSFCAQGLDKKFRAQPEVENVNVTLKDKLIRLTIKDGQDMTDDRIQKLVEDAGYNVDVISRKP